MLVTFGTFIPHFTANFVSFFWIFFCKFEFYCWVEDGNCSVIFCFVNSGNIKRYNSKMNHRKQMLTQNILSKKKFEPILMMQIIFNWFVVWSRRKGFVCKQFVGGGVGRWACWMMGDIFFVCLNNAIFGVGETVFFGGEGVFELFFFVVW